MLGRGCPLLHATLATNTEDWCCWDTLGQPRAPISAYLSQRSSPFSPLPDQLGLGLGCGLPRAGTDGLHQYQV